MLYVVSPTPLALGQGLPSTVTYALLRDARAAATAHPQTRVWIATVGLQDAPTGPFVVIVVRVHHQRLPSQLVLWQVCCQGCGKAFHPVNRGRQPTRCEACRPGRRAEMFAARARRARAGRGSCAEETG